MDKEREQTRFIIQRFDNYINGANTKGNFLLAFNTFLAGGIISNYNKIKEFITSECGVLLLDITLIGLFLVSLTTTIFIIKAVYPFLDSGNSSKEKYHSHIFFNSVAEFESDKKYYESYSAQTDKEVEEDLARQAYQVAKGLKKKFNYLEWAMRFVYVELALLLIILILLIIF